MKRTTTIEWTTITEDESSWPPAYSYFIIERGKDCSYMAYRSIEGHFIVNSPSRRSHFHDYIGMKWTPKPLAPLEFNETP